jgi:site-specific DNA recombinase
MRAALYARVSREEQAEGYSIEAQLEAMRSFCEGKGWTVAMEYVEPGHTATVRDRPALSAVLCAAEQGQFDILLTHQLDRFFRNLRLQLETLGQLGRYGVGYLSVTEQIDYATPQGMLFMQMLGAFNEYYVANLRREVKKGKRGRAMKGLPNAGVPTHGYQRVDGRDVVDPEAAATVRRIFELYATDQYSYQALANTINAEGRNKDRHWNRHAVARTLANAHYIGWVRYNDQLYPGQHEPIISQGLWEQVQAVAARRRVHRPKQRNRGVPHYMQGLVVCGECGNTVYSEVKRGRLLYYRCSARGKGLSCSQVYTRAELVDEHLAQIIQRIHLPEDWRQEAEARANQPQQNDIEGKRKYLTGKLRRLRDLYVEGDYTKKEYDSEKRRLEADLASIQPTVDISESAIYIGTVAELWQGATRQQRKQIVRTLFQSVRIDLAHGRVLCVEPKPEYRLLFERIMIEREGCFYEKT